MIRLAVISDIHSQKKKPDGLQGGYYYPNMPEVPVSQNPFASLKSLFRKNKSKFDYILSPGDFAHQIDAEGLKSSWDQLKIIKNEVHASKLIGTIGNHDVESRGEGDVFKHIKNFDIDFPVYMPTDQNYKDQLLDQGYYVIDDDKLDILILVINSCYHWNKDDASTGKIETEGLGNIKETIAKSSRRIKLALVHHHPIVHETGIYDTGDLIQGSEDLMNSFTGIDLIVHGHKHDHRFTQLKLYPKNLNVLCSGSFSCFKTYLKSGTLNYFHEIEFHLAPTDHCKNPGIIKTYAYDPISGWTRHEGLDEGFGCTLEFQQLKDHLKDELVKVSEPKYIEWEELVNSHIFLRYTSRKTRKIVLDLLKEDGIIKRYNLNTNGIGDIILG